MASKQNSPVCKDKRPVDISGFGKLPDEALVPVKVVAAVSGVCVATVWNQAKTEPLLKPIRMGKRCTRFNVGKLRTLIASRGA